MPQTCSICKHPERQAIENALLRKIPMTKIAAQTNTGMYSIRRHLQHMAAGVVRSAPYEVQQTVQAVSLLDRVQSLIAEIREIAEKAKKDKSWNCALAALRELRSCLELLGKLSGELQAQTPGPRVQIGIALGAGQQQRTESDDGNDADLDARVAECVREATLDFDPVEIARLKMICQQRIFALPEVGQGSGRDIGDTRINTA
jgi:hypothetical protein